MDGVADDTGKQVSAVGAVSAARQAGKGKRVAPSSVPADGKRLAVALDGADGGGEQQATPGRATRSHHPATPQAELSRSETW